MLSKIPAGRHQLKCFYWHEFQMKRVRRSSFTPHLNISILYWVNFSHKFHFMRFAGTNKRHQISWNMCVTDRLMKPFAKFTSHLIKFPSLSWILRLNCDKGRSLMRLKGKAQLINNRWNYLLIVDWKEINKISKIKETSLRFTPENDFFARNFFATKKRFLIAFGKG